MTATAQAIQTPDFSAIKAKQNAAWASGDYARIGTTLQIVGETLAEAMNLRPGSTVLDIAAGNGNATLAFARRFMDVTSTDYVDALLGRGRARAEAEGQRHQPHHDAHQDHVDDPRQHPLAAVGERGHAGQRIAAVGASGAVGIAAAPAVRRGLPAAVGGRLAAVGGVVR